jgi:hypothetical protein
MFSLWDRMAVFYCCTWRAPLIARRTVRARRSLRGITRRQCQTLDGSLVAALPLDFAAELSRKGIGQPAAESGIGSRAGLLVLP